MEVFDTTSDKERLLIEWRNAARERSYIHHQAFLLFQYINIIIMTPIITLSVVSGGIHLVRTRIDKSCLEDKTEKSQLDNHHHHHLDGPHALNVLNIVLGCISLLVAALTTFHQFLNIGKQCKSHEDISREYDRIARDISVQLLLYNTNETIFANIGECIKDVNVRFNKLLETAPTIPEKVIHHYEKHMEKNGKQRGITLFEALRKSEDNGALPKTPHFIHRKINLTKIEV